MGCYEMKCFYKELDRRRKYLIAQLHNEVGHLGDMWFQQEITDAEYSLRIKELDKRIGELEG